jgi:hypothetical protein
MWRTLKSDGIDDPQLGSPCPSKTGLRGDTKLLE